jgi:hypothetical protein
MPDRHCGADGFGIAVVVAVEEDYTRSAAAAYGGRDQFIESHHWL